MADVQITITDNGPYKVTGAIDLFDAGGEPVATNGTAVFLCRCGGSTNKPFCDGTHSKVGFEGAIAAVGGGGRLTSARWLRQLRCPPSVVISPRRIA